MPSSLPCTASWQVSPSLLGGTFLAGNRHDDDGVDSNSSLRGSWTSYMVLCATIVLARGPGNICLQYIDFTTKVGLVVVAPPPNLATSNGGHVVAINRLALFFPPLLGGGQILFQSSKVIPVMIVGVLLLKKRYMMVEYVATASAIMGLVLFSIADSKSSSSSLSLLGIGARPIPFAWCIVLMDQLP